MVMISKWVSILYLFYICWWMCWMVGWLDSWATRYKWL